MLVTAIHVPHSNPCDRWMDLGINFMMLFISENSKCDKVVSRAQSLLSGTLLVDGD